MWKSQSGQLMFLRYTNVYESYLKGPYLFVLLAPILNNSQVHMTIYRVRTGPGKPGKSWNIIMSFSRSGKSWKKATGPGKFWKSVKLN